MNLAVFGYNFKHKKTQDFIFYLMAHKMKPKLVLLQNFKKLHNIHEEYIRVAPKHVSLWEPIKLCEAFEIQYVVCDHNSEETIVALKEYGIDIAIIAGARIIKEFVIEEVEKGIINLHPGLIPETRGLDTIKWAIYNNAPFGVTAHLIDKRIDGGYILIKETIEEYEQDTLIDIGLRVYEHQLSMIKPSIEKSYHGCKSDFLLVGDETGYYRQMSENLERQIPELFKARKGMRP